jgi:3' terminal RNA ribose 2'-O-methyltransferase Hen1
MLLTITTTHRPATDLGYLLHKNPAAAHEKDLSWGKAHLFFPEAREERCTAALLLDLDPVGLVRGRREPLPGSSTLAEYVNDRPYVASSFLSVAIAEVLGSALHGRSRERPELAETPLPLEAVLPTLVIRGGEPFLRRLFEPLGYAIAAQRHPLDEAFPAWGEGPYYAVTLSGTLRLQDLLSHLYVLIPVLDHEKHYWVARDELEKLLARGEGWLASHPEREAIAHRYLYRQPRLAREALARLVEEDGVDPDEQGERAAEGEEVLEKRVSLAEERVGSVLAVLRDAAASSVIDLGCGEGRLVRALLEDKQFERIVGMDVSPRSLEFASRRLRLEEMPPMKRKRVELMQGSLTYRDARLEGFDAACLIEVIEHLDPTRLEALERVVFEFARPRCVVVTTPNQEYNALFEALPAGAFRHADHRFEWNRAQFRAWAEACATRHGYTLRFLGVGPEDATRGAPTQMGVFRR